jgi:uncharacterized protein (TIGR03086 family)
MVVMPELIDRFDVVTSGFTEVVRAVPPDAWDDPAPCEGWVARDVVGHLVEWVPALLHDGWGVDRPEMPTVDDDPLGAWSALRDSLRAGMAVPEIAAREADILPGRFRWDVAVDMFVVGDVLVHTWDLARATGQDVVLDPAEVHRMYEGIVPMDEVLRSSGHYGPRVEVPDDADEQTRLLAFTGRHP